MLRQLMMTCPVSTVFSSMGFILDCSHVHTKLWSSGSFLMTMTSQPVLSPAICSFGVPYTGPAFFPTRSTQQ